MATKPASRSLADFLASRPKPPRDCAVCRLPQAAEINGTRTKPGLRPGTITGEDISAWLKKDFGVIVTAKAIQFHFIGKHHRTA